MAKSECQLIQTGSGWGVYQCYALHSHCLRLSLLFIFTFTELETNYSAVQFAVEKRSPVSYSCLLVNTCN